MKPVDELLEAARATLTTSLPTAPGETEQASKPAADEGEQPDRQAVRRIFATLKIAFPSWYEKHYGELKAEQMARRLWLVATQGLGDVAIDRGLRRMVAECNFPPSPKDFVDLCVSSVGIPTEAEAWEMALRGDHRHEAVRVAAEATGTFDLKTARLNDKGLRDRFNRNYAIVRARAVMGKPLDDRIAEGIGHDSKTPMQAQLAAMHQTARDLIIAQGLPTDGKAARAHLLAMLGIKRRDNHA